METFVQKSSLTELADRHLSTAGTASSGRSAHTVHGGHTSTLRQTLIALTAGQQLDEHENPGEATVLVLRGRIRMTAADDSCEADTGDLLTVPDSRHSLQALHDTVILLTVAKLT
jgi:quercetin dioxygenase-like cupin family protein